MWLIITIGVFLLARSLCQKFKSPFMNPMLISLAVLIPLLTYLKVPFESYYAANHWLNQLLQPAIVALAYPLYEQLPKIRTNWRIILLTCSLGSIMSMLTATIIAVYLHADMSLIASLLGKSVTMPIAVEVSRHLGGEPAIAAALVLIVGLFGAMIAYPIYNLLNITHPIAKGLTMGTVSHALGTATCAEKDGQDAAFSSLALVLCGVTTSLVAPLCFRFALWLAH